MKRTSSIWHFLSRLAGLIGLLAVVVGLVAWLSLKQEQIGQIIVIAGGSLVALSLIVEARGLLRLVGSRRGAVGFTVMFQVLLAVVLLVGVNWFSFEHWRRYDWTRDHIFTIDEKLRPQLAKLTGTTDIIVYQMHVSFGQAKADNDSYDAAAEHKIVEKVKDLVEQFEEFGPRFRVQVLDKQDLSFPDRLEEIRKHSKDLAEAIEKAPENSIFIHANNSVQRLAFHDVYQLDRRASRENNDKRGNLVLSYQGLGPFANKILNVEEKRPRIAVATVNPLLALNEEKEEIGMKGTRTVLESEGFLTTDLLLHEGKRGRLGPVAVYTYDESTYKADKNLQTFLEKTIPQARESLTYFNTTVDHLKNDSLVDLNKRYIYVRPVGGQFYTFMTVEKYQEIKGKIKQRLETSDVDKNDRIDQLERHEMLAAVTKADLDRWTAELESVRKRLKSLKADDLEEKERIREIRQKMGRILADCDLLMIPRLTLIDAPEGEAISNGVHNLSSEQFLAVRDFIAAGKPVLFCLGPSNNHPEAPPSSPDDVEKALTELGFRLPIQTVLYNVEIDSFSQVKGNFLIPGGGSKVDIPPPLFEWKPGLSLAGKTRELFSLGKNKHSEVDPLSASLRSKYRHLSLNPDMNKEFGQKVRHPRPVYYLKPSVDVGRLTGLLGILPGSMGLWQFAYFYPELTRDRFLEKNALLTSDPAGWNDAQPFTTEARTPRFDPPKSGDAGNGTIEERRQGSFPIAAAAEVEVPKDWSPGRDVWAPSIVGLGVDTTGFGPFFCVSGALPFNNKDKVKARIAVIGSGTIFTGKRLNPIQQACLLDTCNWLLGREDLLAKDTETWQYPRVHFAGDSLLLWEWSTRLGMPLIFVFLGVVMWMVRRMR